MNSLSWKDFATLGILHLAQRAVLHHGAARHHVAVGCWVCMATVVMLLAVFWSFASFFLPPSLDAGAPLRSLIFAATGIRPPADGLLGFKPAFTLTPAGSTDTIAVRNGMRCFTGDVITVSFKLEQRANVLVFGYDGKNTYRLERTPAQMISYSSGEVGDRVQLSENLPGETLTETIFVVWSNLSFDPDKEIFSRRIQVKERTPSGGL